MKGKWRQKQWVKIFAPDFFGGVEVAETPAVRVSDVLNRTVSVTLKDFLDCVEVPDPLNQVKVVLQVKRVDGGNGYTVVKEIEMSREFLRGLVPSGRFSRGKSVIETEGIYSFRDGAEARVFAVVLSESKMSLSKKKTLRRIVHELFKRKADELKFYEFIKETLLGKTASDIYLEAKKLCKPNQAFVSKVKVLKQPRG